MDNWLELILYQSLVNKWKYKMSFVKVKEIIFNFNQDQIKYHHYFMVLM